MKTKEEKYQRIAELEKEIQKIRDSFIDDDLVRIGTLVMLKFNDQIIQSSNYKKVDFNKAFQVLIWKHNKLITHGEVSTGYVGSKYITFIQDGVTLSFCADKHTDYITKIIQY